MPAVNSLGTDPAPGPNGKVTAAAGANETAQKSGRPSAPLLESLAQRLELARKITVSLTVMFLLAFGLVFLICEVLRERFIIDPIAVQLEESKGSLAREKIGHEVSRYFALIQRVGAREWQANTLSSDFITLEEASGSILNHPINLKEFGTPLNLTTTLSEMVRVVGIKHPTIKMSVSARRLPPGYTATVTLADSGMSRASCDIDESPQAAEELVECLALNAMSFIDARIAATYVLRTEQRICSKLELGPAQEDTIVREEKLVQSRRDLCAFTRTQAFIAQLLERSNTDDALVLYLSGHVHLARATSVGRFDAAEQLSELDQAIGRFSGLSSALRGSVSAVLALVDAHIRKGVSLHERSFLMPWSDDRTSPIQWQLSLAESTFDDAEAALKTLPQRRSDDLDAGVKRLEAQLAYRRWMLMAHRRTKSVRIAAATARDGEREMLLKAARLYQSMMTRDVLTMPILMEWGDVLRAMGDNIEDAAEKYRRAADRDPTAPGPRQSIAAIYLDRVINGNVPADPLYILVGLGAAADYLSWASTGGPYGDLISTIAEALNNSGYDEDRVAFNQCASAPAIRTIAATPAASDASRWRSTAELKVCVNLAIERVNARFRATAAPSPR